MQSDLPLDPPPPDPPRDPQSWVMAPRVEPERVIDPIEHRGTLLGWFALVYMTGLVYGTLYPWSGWRSIGLSGFDFLFQPWPRYWTLFDLLTNLLLYVPIGALLTWQLRQRLRPWLALLLPWLIGVGLSLTMEALQTFLPGRIPSSVDLLCNSLGTLAGSIVALSLWPTRLRQQPLRLRPHATVVVVLLAAWLAVQALPQRLPFENGLFIGPLMEQLEAADSGPQDSALAVFSAQLAQALEPVQSGLSRAESYADIIEAGVVASWLAAVGMMLSNVLTLSTWRPVAIGALLVAALLIHTASSGWLFGAPHWAYLLSAGAQGGAVIGVLGLSILSSMRRRHRLLALVVLLIVATILTNLVPMSAYRGDTTASAVQPAWRNLFGLLQATAIIWPFAAIAAALSEWVSLGARRRP